MKVEQLQWTGTSGWENYSGSLDGTKANFVLVFGDSQLISESARYDELKNKFPEAHILGCSTSGNIIDTEVLDECITATAVHLEKSNTQLVSCEVKDVKDSFQAGVDLVKQLAEKDGLKHVLIISEGLGVNGSELAKGANSMLPESISITGGLAGDGYDFKKTWIIADHAANSGTVGALGIYGDIQVKHGCVHGWEDFGIKRKVTKSKDNVVFEIDGEPALALYKKYLGEENAKDLPSSGLRFPISVELQEGDEPLVRTLLAIDEETQSLTFAGDVPEGKTVFLMKAQIEGLVEAAEKAAQSANLSDSSVGLAMAVSCVGRRLVMTKLVEEEVEAVKDTLGDKFSLTGYYSYGELAPTNEFIQCQLHNQTMTLTTMTE